MGHVACLVEARNPIQQFVCDMSREEMIGENEK
jgi:hypothetical protein